MMFLVVLLAIGDLVGCLLNKDKTPVALKISWILLDTLFCTKDIILFFEKLISESKEGERDKKHQ